MIKSTFILAMLSLVLSDPAIGQSSETFTVSGQIADGSTGEDLIGATIYVPSLELGATSNEYGFYSLTLPTGTYQVQIEYLGYAEITKEVVLDQNRLLNIELTPISEQMEAIVVVAESVDEHVTEVGMSKTALDIKTITKLPALLGEVDVVKALQLLPGVASIGEGGSGFYVRGGNVDQNLILLDEAPVYNASHLLGFFSVFNPDAVKDIQFYKGAMPANFGGRLSSVVDIRMKEGNSKAFSGNVGLGLISSRLTVEAPLGNKASFILSGRRTYGDLLYRLVAPKDEKQNGLFFHDLNGKINYKINKNNRVFLSAYSGLDSFFEKDELESDYGNKTMTFRWNHLFSQKLFSNLTLYASEYKYRLALPDDVDGFEWKSNLRDVGMKYDMGVYLNPKNTVKFGIQSILHTIDPGNVKGIGNETIFEGLNIEDTRSIENAIHIAHEYEVSNKLKINYGLRVSGNSNIGPQTVFNYDNFELKDSTVYSDKKIFKSYINLEPRVGLRYQINESKSIKASYNRTAQYINLASNTSATSPLDVWFLSSPNVKPQLAHQFAVGYFENLNNNGIEASVELYYKQFKNALDFKDHAQLLLNEQLDGELRFGKGRSYGLELLIRKTKGPLTGWIAYTLSKTERQIDQINNEKWYPTKYDRTHDIAVVSSYELSDRLSISASWIYKTGAAVTYPTGKYYQFDTAIPVYSERNAERTPAYHRLDLSANWKWKRLFLNKYDQHMTFSLYNVYFRKNAYSINFKNDELDPSKSIAEKTYLFGIIPSVTHNIKF